MAARAGRGAGRKAERKAGGRKQAPRRKPTPKKARKKKAGRKKAPRRKAAPKKSRKKKSAGKKAARKRAPRRKKATRSARKKKAAPKAVRGSAARKKTPRKQAASSTPSKRSAPKKSARKKAPRRAAPRVRARVRSDEESAALARRIDRESHPAQIAGRHPRRIGIVLHYYAHANAGIVELSGGELHVGDVVQFRGHTTDFCERVEKMEVDHHAVDVARAGARVGIQVSHAVREHDEVFLLSL